MMVPHCGVCSHREMALRVFIILILSQAAISSENYRKNGFIDSLNSGMKFATDILGTESVALKVAEFVVKAFQTANKPASPDRRYPSSINEPYESGDSEEIKLDNRPDYDVNEASNQMTPLKYLVRLFGLQPNQISAVAVNALVFVAQMISTFLAGNKRPNRPYRSEDPTTWILNKRSRKLQELITKAKNESLLDDIEELIKNQGDEEETSCIRLLTCKITPFVHKMQIAVFGKEVENKDDVKKIRGAAAMYRHLPTASEINERSDISGVNNNKNGSSVPVGQGMVSCVVACDDLEGHASHSTDSQAFGDRDRDIENKDRYTQTTT
ncbi:unnamed protein product [Diatraea saccharalis]|uniref:Uncharacterized protein n=1 Tax=Diatraea saccharalis TaxID=40085 RepID=A0A9N9R2H1_9NEOP|nr:unnamed protein product [Diatraea saccharalis]